MFSLLLEPPEVLDPSPLTLAVGLGVHEGIQRHVARELRVKWPNDLFCERLKLAGILVESELSTDGLRPVVVGVGINVSTLSFPGALRDIATSLRLLGADVPRERVFVDVVRGIEGWYRRLCVEGVAAILPRLRAVDALRGESIRVDGVRGRAAGFDAEGHLLLATGEGSIRRVVAGTVEWAE